MKPDVDTLVTVPDAPPEAGPDRALDAPLPGDPAVVELEVELEEEAVAVPLLLLLQVARIAVAASKRTVTLTNVLSDSDVRIDIILHPFLYINDLGLRRRRGLCVLGDERLGLRGCSIVDGERARGRHG